MGADNPFENDPRLAGMGVNDQRTLFPDEMPKPGNSRFLLLNADTSGLPFPEWENQPPNYIPGPDGSVWGTGAGLPNMEEAPRFQVACRKSGLRVQPDIWPLRELFLITKRMLDLINEFDPAAVEARLTDFQSSDGIAVDEPYYIAEFLHKLDIYDMKRSVVEWRWRDIQPKPSFVVTTPITILSTIPESAHVVRQIRTIDFPTTKTWGDKRIFFSREIVNEMVNRRFRRMRFDDPSDGPGSPYGGQSIYVNGNGTGKPR